MYGYMLLKYNNQEENMNINERKHKLRKEKKEWEEEKELIIEEIRLKKDKEKTKGKKKINTSKLIILFLFLNCTLIELFTAYITLKELQLVQITGSINFAPIVTLISAVVGEVIGFAVYAAKATKENTQGGITYQSMMNEYNKTEG